MASALVKACDAGTLRGINTGYEGNCALDVAQGIILVPSSFSWSKTDMDTPFEFFKGKIHAAGSSRFLPLMQGLFNFEVGRQSDVTETNPITNTTEVIVIGGFTFTYTWGAGGLCLAGQLVNLIGRGYSYIPFDKLNQFLVRENSDGTYSGLTSTDITPNFLPKTPTTKTKNVLVFNTPYEEYVSTTKLRKSDTSLTELMGLIEIKSVKAAAASTTKLKVSILTECHETDLIASLGTAWNDLDLHIITNKATGVVVVPTSIAIVNGILEITGTFTSGQTYIHTFAAPSVMFTNSIEGYEGVITSEHLIP